MPMSYNFRGEKQFRACKRDLTISWKSKIVSSPFISPVVKLYTDFCFWFCILDWSILFLGISTLLTFPTPLNSSTCLLWAVITQSYLLDFFVTLFIFVLDTPIFFRKNFPLALHDFSSLPRKSRLLFLRETFIFVSMISVPFSHYRIIACTIF